MSGVGISVEHEGLEQLRKRLERLGLLGDKKLLSQLAAAGESQTRRRITDEQADPEGSAWLALSPGYEARKAQKSSGGLLEFQGNLVDSVNAFVDDDIAGWGSNLDYAAIQHFGGASGMPPGPAAIPARAYLGLSESNVEEMMNIIDNYVDELLFGGS